MIIDNKIRDEKLQCDINRDAAKISALSSGKTDKHEYVTAEEILSSDQIRVIEQAKFTYSPLGKVLEKQTKMIEDQGKKQIKAIEDHGKQFVENDYDTENELLLKEIHDKIVAERNNEINTLKSKIKYDKWKYHFKSEDVNGVNRPLRLVRKIKDGSIDLEKAKENQEKFRSHLNKKKWGKWKRKSEEQKNAMNNLKVFYKAGEKVIKLFDDYTAIFTNAK